MFRSGASVFVGENVTTTKPIGEVVVEEGGNLRILYTNQVVLEAGFEVSNKVSFEAIVSQCK